MSYRLNESFHLEKIYIQVFAPDNLNKEGKSLNNLRSSKQDMSAQRLIWLTVQKQYFNLFSPDEGFINLWNLDFGQFRFNSFSLADKSVLGLILISKTWSNDPD